MKFDAEELAPTLAMPGWAFLFGVGHSQWSPTPDGSSFTLILVICRLFAAFFQVSVVFCPLGLTFLFFVEHNTGTTLRRFVRKPPSCAAVVVRAVVGLLRRLIPLGLTALADCSIIRRDL
jgi:hypothetical protein